MTNRVKFLIGRAKIFLNELSILCKNRDIAMIIFVYTSTALKMYREFIPVYPFLGQEFFFSSFCAHPTQFFF